MAKSSNRPDPDSGEAEDQLDDEDGFDSEVDSDSELDSEDEEEDGEEDYGDDDGPDADPDDDRARGPASGRPGPVERIKGLLAPRPVTGKANTRRAIEQLDERERRLSFAAAGASVVFGILIYAIETSDKSFRLTKGELTPQTTLVVGLVAGALLFGATLVGRRAPVGFVALFTFLAFGTRYLVGVPFLALAVWLLYRSFKIQKEAAAARRTAGTTGSSSSAKASRASAATAPRKGAAKAPAKKKGPVRPEANKRYTPKRPPPPAPKPSRRERKATKASD